MKYTDAQRTAVYTMDKDIVVTAGAGAGKTRVLVDRYIYILKERLADIDEIAAITFTERAAAEMSERIRKAADDEMKSGDKDYWSDVKERLTTAYISTIHSFCGRLLRENPVEANVDPFFDVVLPAQADIWLDEAVAKAVVEALEATGAPDVRPLIMSYGFDKLCANIKALYKQIRDCGFLIAEAAKKTDMEQPDAEAVIYILAATEENYSERKRAANSLDYEDMQRKAVELLQMPAMADLYNHRFKFLMVDEGQDINYIQYRLITSIAGHEGCRLFTVGDAKQSIYRFRGSQVELFDKMAEDISANGGRKLTMAENFRSGGGIIDFVNRQFHSLMDHYEAVKPVRKDHGYISVEILPVDVEGSMESRKQAEAEALAQRIAHMVEHREAVIYDDASGTFRAPRYRDIAVLFQKRTHLLPFEDAFERYDIPYQEISGGGFYDCQEVKDMINILTSIAHPSDIIALVGTLKAFFDINDEMLLAMASCGGIPYALDHADRLPDAYRVPINRAAEYMAKWRAMSDTMNISDMLQLILDDSGYEKRLASRQGGAHMVSNVWKFCDMVTSAAHSGVLIDEFLMHIRIMADALDEGEAPLEIDGNDAVSIMTVHSAKGLEFPVAVIPDMSSIFRSDSSPMIFDVDKGIGIKPDGDSKGSKWQDIKDKLAQEQQREHMRLMYVAFTRAKDRLILSSDDVDTTKQKQPSWWKWLKDSGISLTQNNHPLPEIAAALDSADMPVKRNGAVQTNMIAKGTLPELLYRPVTPLITYMQCPRQYYYEYVLQLDSEWFAAPDTGVIGHAEGMSAVRIGDIVHSICEKLKHADEIDALVDEALDGLDASIQLRERIRNMVVSYAEGPYFSCDADEVKVELPFIMKLDENIALAGRIDRMIIKDGHATIVDFKTGFVHADNIESISTEYMLQLAAYAMAARQVFGLVVDEAVIYYLESNIAYKVDISPEAIDEARRRLIDAVKAIESAKGMDDFPPSYRHCSRCGYKICENAHK
ncbi:UvrD-helicase domain-containing protein [Mahella sp.]|uniref:UvrD-helicase domain-containing protein n=1 Tax=Mahella sp. TaxID=2798721 RepID=UPI0025C37DC9|nr:UvrD-helicase domain-containing protein [Mahella sp.]MBZ4665605.1 UvrD/REP helicase [Mahella sp.]